MAMEHMLQRGSELSVKPGKRTRSSVLTYDRNTKDVATAMVSGGTPGIHGSAKVYCTTPEMHGWEED